MENKQEVVVTLETNEVSQADLFISQAIAKKAPIETMERLFALKEKYEASEARKAFVRSLSKFQSECPIIEKTKKVLNKDGRTVRYTYAPLDAIAKQIQKPLAANGLSYKWEVSQKDDDVEVTAIITHEQGHRESSTFTIKSAKSEFMTAPQSVASALTFAKRYSLCNALGIATGDEDNDATTADNNKNKAALSDKSKIIFLLKTLKKPTTTKEDIEKGVIEVAHLELKEENYSEIIGRLEASVEEMNYGNHEIQ